MTSTTPVSEPLDIASHLDVVLRDGTTLRLRAPADPDGDRLVAFFERLSPQSRYTRFHGARRVDAALVAPFLDPDWDTVGALVGVTGDPADERIVALASYSRLRDRRVAEVAFAVDDALQGRGIATRLLERLAAIAGRAGIERFVAEVMPGNRAMSRVFEDAGFETSRELTEGVIEVRFPIRPTEEYLARVEERDHTAVVASLVPFFRPRSVAVIGASRRRGSIGGELFRNVLRADFAGAAYPVNRGAEPVAGVRGYETIEEIPDGLDLAVICVPGERVLGAAEAALRKGVRALCVISAGFAETGAEGAERQDRLLALVRGHGARLIGPNCLGLAVASVSLNATFGPRALPPGPIAFSSQSGALGLALLERAAERGLGLSAFVSIGNKADVSSNDLLEYWEEDEATGMVILYLESFGNPRRFGTIARRVARSKPILALKSGTSRAGARAASSHTAALAGSEAAVDALFHQAGVLRARTLEELIDTAVLLSKGPLPRGRRVAIATNAGGLGILCADACETAALELAELTGPTVARLRELLPAEASVANPVDMLGGATGKTYEAVLPVLLADPRVDALIALFVPPVVASPEEVAAAIAAAAPAAAEHETPLVAAIVAEGPIPEALRAGPVAAFSYPEAAAAALGLVAERAEWLRRPAGVVPELDGIDEAAGRRIVEAALARDDEGWLTPDETRVLLESYGLPLVPQRAAHSPAEAVAVAMELGLPAVVKTAAAGAHKTETGGVALDLATEEAVREAAERISGDVIVQPMVRGGAELFAGVVQDPVFGPLVAFGTGGVFAELYGAVEFRIAPLTDVDAAELATSGKAGRLVRGYRGAPPADESAVRDLLHRLSQLGDDLPEVIELDVNPVLAGPDGCTVVDARIRVARPVARPRAKTW